MRIAIDARFINPENRGLSTYTRNLVFGLEKLDLRSRRGIDQKNLYYILLRGKDYATIQFHNPNFIKIRAESHWYGIKEQILIPKILYRLKPDLVHFPHFNVPIAYNRPFVTTIHDLILFAFPTKKATTLGPFLYGIKNRAYHFTITHALKKAGSIITVSKNTAQDIQKYFPYIDAKKITTIYEGAGGEDDNEINNYKKISQKKRREWLQKKLSIKFPFIFYIGGAYPHKNLERLILGFNAAKNSTLDRGVGLELNPSVGSRLNLEPTKITKTAKPDNINSLHLVIAGGNDYFFDRLKKLVAQKKIKNVIFPGFVSDRKTLEFLYQEALFCIFPSLYEGFGLPPLEALKRDKLVLCSNSTCFPEILGDSVIYFNGNSINATDKTISETLANLESLKKTYLPRASKTLARYDWAKMAQETLRLYEKTITKRKIEKE